MAKKPITPKAGNMPMTRPPSSQEMDDMMRQMDKRQKPGMGQRGGRKKGK